MKKLTLLRHAKSGDDGLVARDIDRRLNAKGRRAARAIGRHLRDTASRFDAVVASPAVRVAETVEEVSAGYGRGLAPIWDRRIYLASASELIDLIRGQPAETGSLLLIGHNPGLEDLVLTLVPASDGKRGAVEEKYPTGSLAEIDLDIEDWADLAPATGGLARFVRPRDLDPELGPDAL
ncbi:histidine phosphatase family protein [Sphingomonas sp. BIUV-7]|uniref:Histidine phosphatase family protein n=1 Tax=Sphingomonas natans TaxID=3063330 RepID=A0ABT8YE30_9SPHN|nr:histidine phosphatase family protein [Sphingomonas sp. BIUV-7]MDO6416613.1 histidine phosphatase family protein [Sphingomonas sp. BIUV-7]